MSRNVKGLLISNFNVNNLASFLRNDKDSFDIEAVIATFGQVVPVLMQVNLDYWQSDWDFTVVWTQPESVIPAFYKMLNYESSQLETILKEVDAFAAVIKNIQSRAKSIFVPTWVFPTYQKNFSLFDMKKGVGLTNTIMQMNLRLAENLESVPAVHLLNSQRWIEVVGRKAFNPKTWYMGKIPFHNDVFKEASTEITSVLNAIQGNAKKLIVLDLDDTLWGGIVGDLGWENIKLGGHDHIGEAYVDFQRGLKALTRRGILLSIVSKNEEAVALEAIVKHPEMVLELEDFAGWKINWQDKAQNIVDLVSQLNLGLQSVVFIDDNPVERMRVKDSLPEVLVPDWPQNKMLYRSSLLALDCFNADIVSQEDLKRTKMYRFEQQRQDLKRQINSLDDWLKTLDIKVVVESLTNANLQRTTQLLNKTNQMNLTTRRMTETELFEWALQDNHKLWSFRVSDKFGDSGLTGIISLEITGDRAKVVDFVLSCRVMGRQIEETMLSVAMKNARSMGVTEIQAKYIPTDKNKPCLKFWRSTGFEFNEAKTTFSGQSDSQLELPAHINILETS